MRRMGLLAGLRNRKVLEEGRVASRPRWRRGISRALTILVVGVLWGGCAGPVPHRWSGNDPGSWVGQEDAIRANVHEFRVSPDRAESSFSMAFIEFTEQGSLAAPAQLEAAAKMLDSDGTDATPILLFYLHGWKNNSRSGDVMQFCDFASHLARCVSRVPLRDGAVGKYRLYCVYLAWNGSYFSEDFRPDYREYEKNGAPLCKLKNNPSIHDSQIGSLVDYGTFWSRKAAAQNMASLELIEVITALSERVHQNPDARSIAIAHSFGALILEKSLAQALPAMVHGDSLTLPFDLTLLLNPAAEAVTAYRIIDFFKRRLRDCESEAAEPAIVTVNAMNDVPTRYAFTAGTIPKTLALWLPWNLFLNHKLSFGRDGRDVRSVRVAELMTCTAGHSRYLPSHDLRFVGELPREETGHPLELGKMGFDAKEMHHRAWNFRVNLVATHPNRYLRMPQEHEAILWQNPGAGEKRVASLWRCVPVETKGPVADRYRVFNRTPNWIVRVPPTVIDGHGGIWSDNAKSLMTALYRMSGRFHAPSRRTFRIKPITEMGSLSEPNALVEVEGYRATRDGAPIPEPRSIVTKGQAKLGEPAVGGASSSREGVSMAERQRTK